MSREYAGRQRGCRIGSDQGLAIQGLQEVGMSCYAVARGGEEQLREESVFKLQ